MIGVRLPRDKVLKGVDDVLKIYTGEELATEEVVEFAKDIKALVNNLAEATTDGEWIGDKFDCSQTFRTCSVCGMKAPVAPYCNKCGAHLL